MVLKKRFESRTISFEVPVVPRAPRSSRESKSSSASNNASVENDPLTLCKDGIKEERQHVDKPSKVESLEQGSCDKSTFVAERNLEWKEQKCKFESCPLAESDHSLERTSVISGSASFDNARGYAKPVVFDNVGDVHMNDGTEGVRMESTRKSIFKDLSRGRSVATNDHEINLQKPLCRDPARMTSFSGRRTGTNLVGRDDDENFSRMNKCSNRLKSFRYHQRVGDHRIRKLLSSKYWRPTPKLKEFEFSKADGDVKPMLVGYKRKAFHKRERYLGDCLYKKRKLFDRGSIVTTDDVVSGESNSNLPKKSMNAEEGILVEEGGTSTSISPSRASLHIKETNVKFSIKSFKIPELFIDVPSTTTVGSLKRTIVEAITAILGSGLRVGVVLRGKKIRDDNRTLLQTGLSCQENLEKLGFTLEPTLENTQHAAAVSENPPPEALTRVQEANMSEIAVSVADQPLLTDASNRIVDNTSKNIPSTPDNLVDNDTPDCTALIPLSAVRLEPLAVVPMNQKNKRSELSQRRIRRPFSVTEVEALVHAIEELGTGRWCDVKLRAFENADHRTYVDLKDKWKTLVHTASISPQQRRGEPVPQELLDRVLSAHAYWSQHQGKQHAKHPAAPLKIAGTPTEGIQVGGT